MILVHAKPEESALISHLTKEHSAFWYGEPRREKVVPFYGFWDDCLLWMSKNGLCAYDIRAMEQRGECGFTTHQGCFSTFDDAVNYVSQNTESTPRWLNLEELYSKPTSADYESTWLLRVSLLKGIMNDRISGDDLVKSLQSCLPDVRIDYAVTRLFATKGLLVQKRVEGKRQIATFEDLVGNLFTNTLSAG